MTLPAMLGFAIAIAVGLAVTFVVLGLFLGNKNYVREREIDELLDDIVQSELDSQLKDSNLLPQKSWFGHWFKLASSAGQASLENPKMPGWIAISIGLLGFMVGTFAWPGEAVIGLLFAIIGVFLYRITLIANGNKRLAQIDKQLPALLAGMRSSLSANMTPQQAILTQIGEVPNPLGEELVTLKGDLDLNIPLDQALANLSNRVPSPELRFLVSSMRIAISQGADLDELLRTLQDILVARASIKDKLSAAIAQAQPAIYITALAVPLGLVFSYTTDEKNREFWFSLMGLIAFGFVIALYIAALFFTNKQVKKVKEA